MDGEGGNVWRDWGVMFSLHETESTEFPYVVHIRTLKNLRQGTVWDPENNPLFFFYTLAGWQHGSMAAGFSRRKRPELN